MSRMTPATDVVILCGGLGTRLRSVVADRPKSLAPILGRPFLTRLLHYLADLGVQRVILCTGYMGETIRAAYGDGSHLGLALVYSQEATPQGTGGALRSARPFFRSNPILVLNGDSWCSVNFERLLASHAASGAKGTCVIARVSKPQHYGRVAISQDGKIQAFEEKGETSAPGWVSAGVYVLSWELVEAIPEGRFVSLEREVFPRWTGGGLYGYPVSEGFLDIGTPESYEGAEAFFRELERRQPICSSVPTAWAPTDLPESERTKEPMP